MSSTNTSVDPSIFKAYDIRGIYGESLTDDVAYRVGRAAAQYLNVPEIAVGRDMRLSSPQLAAAIIRGITDQGINAVDLGLLTTDALYFAVGKFNYPAGVMITASHNPKQYNGIKTCREQAIALSSATGLNDIRDLMLKGDFPKPEAPGRVIRRDVTEDYIDHALSFIDVSTIKPLKIAVDAGNGMAGMSIPRVFKRLPCQLVPLYFELDGNFPNHPASPIEPDNLVDGDMVTALVSKNLLRKHPGATILYNLICSRSTPETIKRAGGKAIRTRVGHSFIKAQMREENAIFGGEHSGHFYFRDNWYADSGLIAFLLILELISIENKPLSELIKPLDTWVRSGEINTQVNDVQGKVKALEEHYAALGAHVDHLDGITISFPDWWFNVRPSNTEPLLRLNVEADTKEELERRRDEVLRLIRQR